MTIVELLQNNIEYFKEKRSCLMESASLPPSDVEISFGEPPFVVDDGSSYYCILQSDGTTLPLPYAYELSDEDVSMEDDIALFSWPATQPGGGIDIARLIPVAADIEIPDEGAFQIEDVQSSELWDTTDQMVDAVRDALFNDAAGTFAERLWVGAFQLNRQFDEIESLDQALTVLLSQGQFVPTLFTNALEVAINELRQELDNEEDDDE